MTSRLRSLVELAVAADYVFNTFSKGPITPLCLSLFDPKRQKKKRTDVNDPSFSVHIMM